jgi:hypothetical protein
MKVSLLHKVRKSFACMTILLLVMVLSSHAQGLLREYWSGVSGTAVSNLTGNANYPNNPTSRNIITTFEGPTNLADNYGTRIRGYVVPPSTGSYTFWIASDDNSELWLSTGADPAAKTLIASVTSWTNSREWTKYSSQQSSARTLTAGQKYYIEVLQKEGTGGDNVAVGWQGPGITGDAERPIPGSRLVPYELGLLREVWTGISGTAVSELTSNANYPNSPNTSETIYTFETPINTADNYGTRLRGYIVPPTTGSYTFWIASDDNSELWLSTSADPAGKALIANVPDWTNSREWTKFSSQQSTARTLTAGQKYYIEVLQKEASGGDNCAVGWQGPGISGDAERPIPASRLIAWTGGNQTYSLTVNNDGHGTTSPSGTVTVDAGTATTISATPATGYQFSSWTVTSGTASIASPSSASTTVTLTSGNATIRANFTALTYSLTMSNDGHGTTTPSGTVTVNHGVATSISATPSTGYQFLNWTVTSGTASIASPSSASTTVTLTSGNATIRANFTTLTYSLTMTNDGNGTTTPSGTITVNHGAATSISATPSSGWSFANWTVTSGTASIASPSSATTTVTLTSGNATIRANFTQQFDTLTVSNDGNGSTVPSGLLAVGRGIPVTITATANNGYHFVNWAVLSGTAQIANPAAATTTVTLTAGNAAIRADFAVDLPGLPNNRQISISGELFDENGDPVGSPTPATVEMAVRLCNQAVGGDTLYYEEFLITNAQGVVVDNGRFVVRLGTGVASSDLMSVISSNENLFAEITVLGAQPDVLLPRTPVTASPYALSLPAAAAQEKTLHGSGSPIEQSIVAPIGSYYVNDTDGTTWIRINNGWRMMD